VQAGLEIRCPVLVLSSDRTTFTAVLDERAHTTDIVLDVTQIRRWAGSLGSNVTSIAIPGAVHDVVLSRPQARERAYAEIQRWLTSYVL
jgi:alpha-beta hydrolase superfamily lysophospholipase